MAKVKFELGDLVQLSRECKSRIGIVKADDKSWWVIKGHYDVADCIVHPRDVVRVIQRGAISKGLLKYV